MILAACAAYAEAAYTYGICTDRISTYGTSAAGTNYSVAIEVPEAVAKALQGGSLSSIDYAFGDGYNKTANFYLTYDLEAEPFYTQSATPVKSAQNHLDLTTPYQIEGRAFYIGYTYRQTTKAGKPIAFDGQDMGGQVTFSHLAAWTDKGQCQWTDGSEYGALSIRANIDGVAGLSNAILPVGLSLPLTTAQGEEFDYSIRLMNLSTEPVNSATLAATVGANAEPQYTTVSFDSPLKPGASVEVKLSGVCQDDGSELPVVVAVEKADGRDNLFAAQPCRGSVMCDEFLSPRVVVIEEYTGLGCGWCPAGYVALEQMCERHPYDYIGIAVHNYGSDPMYCADYAGWRAAYVTGAPNATCDRNREFGTNGTFNPQPGVVETYYNMDAGMVNMKLKVYAEYADQAGTSLRITPSLRLGYDLSGERYGFALVQTEDNLGPYYQYNNYSGGGLGTMFGFENEGSYVELMYNDVARAIAGWNGTAAAVPTDMKKGEYFTFDYVMPVASQKIADTHVIALLIDLNKNEIVHAAKCRVNEICSVSALPAAPSAAAGAVAGGIAIDGTYGSAEVYTIDGSKVAAGEGDSFIALPAGLYILSLDGVSSKIMVK